MCSVFKCYVCSQTGKCSFPRFRTASLARHKYYDCKNNTHDVYDENWIFAKIHTFEMQYSFLTLKKTACDLLFLVNIVNYVNFVFYNSVNYKHRIRDLALYEL